MNAKEVVQQAIDHSNLPGVEEWKPSTEERLRGMDTANCIMPDPWQTQPWTPPLTTTTVQLQASPDMTVNVWKAENGFMVELEGKKYIAKTVEEVAGLFVKEFGDEQKA